MRYLGWGIGHHNPPDFPHEADEIIASSCDGELSRYEEPEVMDHTGMAEDVGVEADGASDDCVSADGASDVDSDSDTDAGFDDVFEY